MVQNSSDLHDSGYCIQGKSQNSVKLFYHHCYNNQAKTRYFIINIIVLTIFPQYRRDNSSSDREEAAANQVSRISSSDGSLSPGHCLPPANHGLLQARQGCKVPTFVQVCSHSSWILLNYSGHSFHIPHR